VAGTLGPAVMPTPVIVVMQMLVALTEALMAAG
jgi:hypothetical protein